MAVPPSCVRRSFNIPENMDRRLKEIASKRRATKTSLLVAALEILIDEHDTEQLQRRQKEAA